MEREGGGVEQRERNLSRKRRSHGRGTRSLSFTIPEATIERLDAFVESPAAEGLSRSYHVGEAINEYVARKRRAGA